MIRRLNLRRGASQVLTISMMVVVLFSTISLTSTDAKAQKSKKPNVLMIWGDDIGQSNISAYTRGMMGYHTPNIDRIAKEGMIFTDYYGEQSCTAGRSSFVTGQSVFRTGLSKVGLPGADVGLSEKDPTIAELMKEYGYNTAQFGKNHLGDQDKHLPTNHGFDEFLGNLYHLNAEEEPELRDYPKNPEFKEKFGPRGVLHTTSDGSVEDTGPLTKKRMETIDDETVKAAVAYIRKQEEAGTPWFVWWNGTRMHFRTHLKEELLKDPQYEGLDDYSIGMIEHDMHVGELLAVLDELGIADETVILYTTDNGPHKNTWPDAASSPYRSEKNTNWEGGWRVPAIVKWPGVIEPGSVTNEIMHHMDWFPTLSAIIGNEDIKEELKDGRSLNNKDFKVHLDGYNFVPYFKGEVAEGPRKEVFYFSDDGDLTAMRYGDWKLIFMVQEVEHTLEAWVNPFKPLRIPLMFNLRRDPYEIANLTSNTYWDWVIDHVFLIVPAQSIVAEFLATFQEFPPRTEAASFSIDQVIDMMKQNISK